MWMLHVVICDMVIAALGVLLKLFIGGIRRDRNDVPCMEKTGEETEA